ncbi:uncharacterized protein LOC5507441 [Nematostella vectensis]|uniref:uncharacterized protein LOC5507441 n=1 Tax=Nematostella vectensis TaxID=45351 RepID=UPI002076F652|nr:uncharacterized protein LOC5507441 [Nematostella vectensis]
MLAFVRWLPAISCSLLLTSIVVSYSCAVALGQVHPLFPKISLTAAYEPGGSIFSLVLILDVIATLLLISLYHVHVSTIAKEEGLVAWRALNNGALTSGVLLLFGVSAVATFRYASPTHADRSQILHYVASSFIYIGGFPCLAFNTILTYKIAHVGRASNGIFLLRMFISVIYSISSLSFVVLQTFCHNKYNRHDNVGFESHWKKGEDGYAIHVGGALLELVSLLALATYIISFHGDFKTFKVDVSYYSLLNERDEGDDKDI